MKLRTKVSIIVLVVWALLLAVTYIEGQRLLTSSYLQIEQDEGKKNNIEVRETINRMLSEVSKMAAFWSVFDEAYNFMADKNKKYIEGTVTVPTLGESDIDLMLYYTTTGKFFYGIVVDQTREKIIPMPDGLTNYLEPGGKLVSQTHVDSTFQGLISIPESILLIAAHSIVKSDSTGPVRGSLVIGRRFNDETIKKIETITKLNLHMFKINEVDKNVPLKNIYNQLLENKDSLVVVNEDKDILEGYILLRDIDSHPIAIIESTVPRDIYQSGIQTIYYFNIIFFGLGIFFIFLLSFLLRKLVIDRFVKFNKSIMQISLDKEFSVRVDEEGSDELTSLEKETNTLLNTIQNYSKEQKVLLSKVSDELDNVNRFSKKLQATQALLSDSIHLMPSVLVIISKDLTIANINSAGEKTLNALLSQLEGKSIFDVFPFLSHYKNKFISCLENKQSDVITKISDTAGENKNYYDVVIYPLSKIKRGQELAVRIDNITDTVRFEEKLRQNDKLSSIGVLTAGVATEIIEPISLVKSSVTPLSMDVTNIISLLQEFSALSASDPTFKEKFAELSEVYHAKNIAAKQDEIATLLDRIRSSADLTDEIVKNLRLFSRIGENLIKKVNIESGIDSTINLLKYKCSKRIEINKEYGNIPEIECVPGKLNQVFMNVISNAIDAIHGKGEIRIKTYQEDDHIMICIKDNGVGIKDEYKNQIFHPFFTTKTDNVATGLGLSISSDLIKECGGTISFKSEVGLGTEFIIKLPIIYRDIKS